MKKCNHYPMIGMDADVKFGGSWKTLEQDMHHIVRQCIKCGETNTGYFTSYNPESFMPEGKRWQLNKDRENNAVNMIQPIDSKTGKFNEEFGKHYGYNPLKTPAPQVSNTNNDVATNAEIESNLKVNKL